MHAPFEAVWLRPQPAIRDFLMMNGQAQRQLGPRSGSEENVGKRGGREEAQAPGFVPTHFESIVFLSG